MTFKAVIETNKYNYMQHSGIKGMKWGQRRYQNEDGTLTPAGKIRYGKQAAKQINKLKRDAAHKYLTAHPYIRATDRLMDKAAKTSGKKDKYQEMGNAKKAAKLEAKVNKLMSKAAKYTATVKSLNVDMLESREQASKILKDAEAKGITFKMYTQYVSNNSYYTYTDGVKVDKRATNQNG